MAKSIAVIGAGAKAAALVARAAVLKGVPVVGTVPTIHVIEKAHVGAAWDGSGPFSSGLLSLCTPGEKDVGFPYAETRPGRRVRAAVSPILFGRFSWPAYQVANGRTADWVDRGREHPLHRQWAEYLLWVFDQAAHPVIYGEVTGVTRNHGRWSVEYRGVTGLHQLNVDGVIFTGAGKPRVTPRSPGVPRGRIFNAESFWRNRRKLQALDKGVIAVAGAGGAAGAIVAWLAQQHAETDVEIVSVSNMGTLFTRGDGYSERRWFSDPTDWSTLDRDDRRRLVDRTEAGVVSMRLKRTIDRSANVTYERGRTDHVRWDTGTRRLELDIRYNKTTIPREVDYFVSAGGFDSWAPLRLVNDPAVAILGDRRRTAERAHVELKLLADLSLPASLPNGVSLPPGLHLPALAGLAQGPGMGNLGCLGLAAKAIMDSYL